MGVSQLAHTAGDALVAVALADSLFFAVPLGEARTEVALYLLLTMAPFAVLSPLIAPWLGRFQGSLRAAIAAAFVGRVLFAAALSGRRAGIELYPLAFGLLVASRVHGVSRSALVPEATPPGRTLMWVNARLALISVAGGVLGAAPGVALTTTAGPDAVLLLAAATFAAGSLAALDLPRLQVPAEAQGGGSADPDVASPVEHMLSRRLLAGGLAMATSRAAVGFTLFFLAFQLRETGEGERGLAIAAIASGVGGLLGSLIGPPLQRLLPESVVLPATLLVMAGVATGSALRYDLGTAALVAGAVGFASGAGRLAFDSLVQADAPERLRGSVFARYETVFQLLWVGGAVLATALPHNSRGGLLTLAGICVVGFIFSVRRPGRRTAGTAVRRSGRGSVGTREVSPVDGAEVSGE